MREVNLKMNPKKYILFKKRSKIFRHLVSNAGIITDPEKISVVRD